MKILKEFYAQKLVFEKDGIENYFVDDFLSTHTRFLFRNENNLREKIHQEIVRQKNANVRCEVQMFSRDTTPWKRYKKNTSDKNQELSNIQFGIFKKMTNPFWGQEPWQFVDTLVPYNSPIDDYYFTKIEDAEKAKMEYLKANEKSEVEIYYRYVGNWSKIKI